MNCCKSILFNNASVWIKTDGDPDFELIMGSEDL